MDEWSSTVATYFSSWECSCNCNHMYNNKVIFPIITAANLIADYS